MHRHRLARLTIRSMNSTVPMFVVSRGQWAPTRSRSPTVDQKMKHPPSVILTTLPRDVSTSLRPPCPRSYGRSRSLVDSSLGTRQEL